MCAKPIKKNVVVASEDLPLTKGAFGPLVEEAQRALINQGFGFSELVDNGLFDSFMEECVAAFQMAHVDQGGHVLSINGRVDENTWWALCRPQGEDQRGFVLPSIPDGIVDARQSVLTVALEEYKQGVKEKPEGSNWSDGIAKYGGYPGLPWDCLFASWVCYTAFNGQHPLGFKEASAYRAWQRAEAKGFAKKYNPVPGDLFVLFFVNQAGEMSKRGRIGFILAISEDGQWINTIEGDACGRVRIEKRPLAQVFGYISFYGGRPTNWKFGLTGKL